MTYRGASRFVSAILAVSALGGAANATTIGFDGDKPKAGQAYTEGGYSVSGLRIVNGNCLVGSCAAFNGGESLAISLTSGGAFDFTSLSFQFLGRGAAKRDFNTLTITGDNTATISFNTKDYKKNSYHTLTLDDDLFSGVRMLTFTTSGRGNLRLDSFSVKVASLPPIPAPAPAPTITSVTPVPLPASGLLLAGALGLGFLRRRKA